MRKQNLSESREQLEKIEAARKRAARQAARPDFVPEQVRMVECVVLPMGADKISMGIHVSGVGEAHYEEDETFTVAEPIANALKARGYVQIKKAPEPA